MRTSRGDDFFAATFSSSPSPRLRRREKEGSIDDFSSLAREEALMTSHPREEKKTSRHRPFSFSLYIYIYIERYAPEYRSVPPYYTVPRRDGEPC
ncbi:hypothetical protein GW17_00024119 [Ensete ventricosum]|nr:hypothetical protein GW17_00024119 [Ensete ventricosum]